MKPPLVQLACSAMGTRFELLLHDERLANEDLRAIGEEILEEIEQADRRLSAFRRDSVIAAINRRAAREPVRVDVETFALLRRCVALGAQTEGAFAITVGPLLRALGLRGAVDRTLDLDEARAASSLSNLELDESTRTVLFHHPRAELDLGGIGKGYALDRAGLLLEEHDVANAFLHGGTSSLLARGAPQGREAWTIEVSLPSATPEGDPRFARLDLRDACFSVSAPHGRAGERDGESHGHVLDPRLGRSVEGVRVAACVAPKALEADAWSTAWLVLGAAPDVDASTTFEAQGTIGAFFYRQRDETPQRRGELARSWNLPGSTP